jgi:hypothetical protein
LYNRPEVAAVPSGLSPTPLIIIKKNLFNTAIPKLHLTKFGKKMGPPLYSIVTCLLKAGIAEPDETAVVRERLCKYVSTAKVCSE